MLYSNLNDNIQKVKNELNVDNSFDMLTRDIMVGHKRGYIFMIDGFVKDAMMSFIISSLQNQMEDYASLNELMINNISYIELETKTEFNDIYKSILSGAIALFVDGYKECLIIDARTYPARGPQEPDMERVSRGARDGFVETIVFNTALIRRRIRDGNLIFKMMEVGTKSRTDVVLGYLDDVVDHKILQLIVDKINSIDVESVVMGEKTLEELIFGEKWFNPFPRVRVTERPDVASSHILEGHIIIIVDNTPSVMILPTTLFHFTQHAEDYTLVPLTGNYFRFVRLAAIMVSYIIIPLWLLIVYNSDILPDFLSFIGPKEESTVPIFIQFLLLEFGVDLIRLASIHTPNALSSSLGIIGGLAISQFAVTVGWFVPETILYTAFVALGTFATPSLELTYAVKIFRLILLVLTGLFNVIGFVIGILIFIIALVRTKTIDGRSYLWPLFPFNRKAFFKILFRNPVVSVKDGYNQK